MNVHIQIFAWIYIFSSPGYISSSVIAGSYDNSMFNILQTGKLFSKVFAPFYSPTGNEWGFLFLYIFAFLVCVCI